MNRGSGACAARPSAAAAASMRPRFMNRGSDRGRDLLVRHLAASMRPRFMNRGSAAASVMANFPDEKLQ